MKKVISLIGLFLLAACASNQQGGNNSNSDYAFSIVNKNTNFVCSLHQDGTMASDDGIKLRSIYPFAENTFNSLPSAELVDNEETDYNYGMTGANDATMGSRVLSFFKFTFYVKNAGKDNSALNVKFNIKEIKSEDSTLSLIDTLRLMVYENVGNADSHEYAIYAEKSSTNNIDKDGNTTNREFVAQQAQQEDDSHPLVTSNFKEDSFGTNNRYVEYSKESFNKDDQLRYTMVIWLEGFDPDSRYDQAPPLGVSLRFTVEIS